MKKLLIIVSILSMFVLSSQAFAATPAKQHTTIETVAEVWYDSSLNTYMADTEDTNTGSWTIELVKVNKEDEATLSLLKSIYEGKKVKLTYEGEMSMPDDWELISYELIHR